MKWAYKRVQLAPGGRAVVLWHADTFSSCVGFRVKQRGWPHRCRVLALGVNGIEQLLCPLPVALQLLAEGLMLPTLAPGDVLGVTLDNDSHTALSFDLRPIADSGDRDDD